MATQQIEKLRYARPLAASLCPKGVRPRYYKLTNRGVLFVRGA